MRKLETEIIFLHLEEELSVGIEHSDIPSRRWSDMISGLESPFL